MKRKIWQKLLLGLTTIVASGMAVLSISPKTAAADSEPTYTFATNNTFAPFQIQDSKGNYNGKNPGIEIEILKRVAKHEHFKYVLKPMSFNGDLQALESGQVDGIVAGMSVTPERKAKYDFSKSYYTDGVVMAIAKDSKIHSLSQLKGKTVSAKSGTSAAIYLKQNQHKYGYKIK